MWTDKLAISDFQRRWIASKSPKTNIYLLIIEDQSLDAKLREIIRDIIIATSWLWRHIDRTLKNYERYYFWGHFGIDNLFELHNLKFGISHKALVYTKSFIEFIFTNHFWTSDCKDLAFALSTVT